MELIIVLIIILVLFGSSRLPSIGKSLGKTIGNLKKGFSENKKTDVKTKKEVSEEGKVDK
ncbi:MAG: twin-arginine translocase TatA/TatE family subunit [Thermodesulfovibrionales bacterium]